MAARRLADAIERVLDLLLLAAMLLMVVSVTDQVFGRYVLNDAPVWTAEVAGFMMAWITMLASAAVLRRQGHIAVTVVVDALPVPVAAAIGWLRDALILVMAGSLVWYGYAFAVIGGRRDSPALEIPMFWPYLCIPIGGALIAAQLVLSRLARDRSEKTPQ